jgi:hypothetical protein
MVMMKVSFTIACCSGLSSGIYVSDGVGVIGDVTGTFMSVAVVIGSGSVNRSVLVIRQVSLLNATVVSFHLSVRVVFSRV